MPNINLFELLVVLITVLMLYGIPIATAIWILVTLNRIRKNQEVIQNRLDSIEQALHKDR